ncbi:hypothetical protein NLX86_17165 [Streptomyces sp. A3M-1-3]|uniref:hypothetical protein n=1 Tax=Streptomyces sp. A3M-1-3 TaxID=2962044 RepID=UPI0020B7CEDA|nr:hypothetical protein [Streptomyces sp. A3M-1-3]MCP3819763.1 hypothetical protein [Streptomyces sp. A3M-1-3]
MPAALWTAFEVVNVCWPRAVLAPPGAPWYQVWAGLLGTGAVITAGLVYLVARKPQNKLRAAVASEKPCGEAAAERSGALAGEPV